MRLLALLAALCLVGCQDSPASLGITGPSPPAPPTPLDDSVISNPGIPDTSGSYGPNVAPTTSGGRFFNYN